jgi:hypothetical protein
MFFSHLNSKYRSSQSKKATFNIDLSTPKTIKHRSIFENTVCVNKKIINLSEEFEEIYNKRRDSFFRQKHNRLRTVA